MLKNCSERLKFLKVARTKNAKSCQPQSGQAQMKTANRQPFVQKAWAQKRYLTLAEALPGMSAFLNASLRCQTWTAKSFVFVEILENVDSGAL